MTAIRRGLHVYCQKPLTHSIWEARQMTETARTAGVATQMGNQGRSGEGHRQTVEWIRDGAIGAVREVHALFRTNAEPAHERALREHFSGAAGAPPSGTVAITYKTGGKQYRAAKGDVLRVEKIDGDVDFELARVGGHFSCRSLDRRRTEILGRLRLAGAAVAGEVRLGGAKIGWETQADDRPDKKRGEGDDRDSVQAGPLRE